MIASVTYRRIPHAAHYEGQQGKGHDLEQWDVVGDVARSPRTGHPVAPVEVPRDAEYHSGYQQDGVQHWLFVRTAPLTGTCARCEGAKL